MWNGTEMLNWKSKCSRFISTDKYRRGLHYFKLHHLFSFRGISLCTINDKSVESEEKVLKSANNGRNEIRILLDLNANKLCAYNLNNEILFEKLLYGSSFRIIISVSDVGNLIALNPYSLPPDENYILKFIDDNTKHLILKKLSEWCFILNFSIDHYQSDIELFLRTELKGLDDVLLTKSDYIFDERLKVLAFKRKGRRHKELQAANRIALTSPKNILSHDLTCVRSFESGFEFYLRYRMDLLSQPGISVSSDVTLKVDEILLTLKNTQPRLKVSSTSFTLKYISSVDGLLVFNNHNKLKVVYERDERNEFVISPYLFETQRITLHLPHDDFVHFLKRINWSLISKISTPSENLLMLEALESIKESLARVSSIVFFWCPTKFFENLIRCLVRNFISSRHIGFTENSDRDSVSKNENADFSLLFQDDAPTKDPPNSSRSLDLVRKLHSGLPLEDDIAKNVLLRLEEALYQQSPQYAQGLNFSSRSHTSYYRLKSFTSVRASYQVIKSWLDIGCYFKNQTQELCTFYNDDSVFFQGLLLNNPPTEEQLLINKALIRRECVTLTFSLSHQRPLVSSHKILHVELLSKDMLVGILDESYSFKLYSAAFGLIELYHIKLNKSLSTTTKFYSFKSLLVSKKDNIGYFSSQTCSKHDCGIPYKKDGAPIKNGDDEKEKFERLCKLGFNAELCKKALLEIGDEVSEEGVNVVLSYINQPIISESLESQFSAMPHPKISPDPTSSLKEEAIVDDSYFGKKTFTNVEAGDSLIETDPKDSISLSLEDHVFKIGGMFISKKGGIPTLTLLFFYRDYQSQHQILVIYLEYSSIALCRHLIVDGNGQCPSSAWMGRTLLRREFEEVDMADILQESFFLQAHAIFPLAHKEDIFTLFSTQTVTVPPDFVPEQLAYPHTASTTCEENLLIVFNSSFLGKLSLVSASRTATSITHKIKFHRLINLSTPHALVVSRIGIFVHDTCTIRKLNLDNFILEVIYHNQQKEISMVAPLLADNLLIIFGQEREFIFSSLPAKSVLDDIPSHTAGGETSMLSPTLLLSALFDQKRCPVIITHHKNAVASLKSHASTAFLIDIIEKDQDSHIGFRSLGTPKTITIILKLFTTTVLEASLRVARINNLASLSKNVAIFNPCINKNLPLIALPSNILWFFEEMPLANVLFADDEPFTHSHCSEVFAFESSLNNKMEIIRINFCLGEASLNADGVSDLLFFVISDFHLLGELQIYARLTKSEYAELANHNSIKSGLKPIAHVDFESANCSSFTIELQQSVIGRYVAFIPLRKSEHSLSVLCVDFFSVEGNYTDSNPLVLSESSQSTSSVPSSFGNFLPTIILNGEELNGDFKLLSASNLFSQTLITLTTSVTVKIEQEDISLQIRPSSSPSFLYAIDAEFFHCDTPSNTVPNLDILQGESADVSGIMSLFYRNIEEGLNTDEKYVNDFVTLLHRLDNINAPSIIDIVCRCVNWDNFVLFKILNGSKPELDRLFHLLINRSRHEDERYGLKMETLKSLKVEEISTLPLQSQQLVWQLVQNSASVGPGKRAAHQFFTQIILFALHNIEELNVFEEKVLRLGGLDTSARKEIYLETSCPSSADLLTLHYESLILASQSFYVREPTFHDYYVEFERAAKVQSIHFRVNETEKIDPFTLSLFVANPHSEFVLVFSKSFDHNFCHQSYKSSRQKQPLEVSLELPEVLIFTHTLRIQISFNYLSSFRYTHRSLIEPFMWKFYGTSRADDASSKDINRITLLRNALEASLGTQGNISEIVHSSQSSAEVAVPASTQVSSLSHPQTLEALYQLQKLIQLRIHGFNPSDLLPGASSLCNLKPLIDQRAQLLAQVMFHNIWLKNDANVLSYWVVFVADFCSKVLNTLYATEFISFLTSNERTEVAVSLIYNLPLFEGTTAGKVKLFQRQLLSFMNSTEHICVLQKLISIFLKEKELIFIVALNRFACLLVSSGIQMLDWQSQADEIARNWLEAGSEEEWRHLLVRFSILIQTLEVSVTERSHPLGSNTAAMLIKFILNHKLTLVNPQMLNLVNKLVQIFCAAQFFIEGSLSDLRDMILELNRANLLSIFKASLEEQITGLRLMLKQTSNPSLTPRARSATSMANHLEIIITDFIVLPGADERMSLIEFCFSALVDLAGILLPYTVEPALGATFDHPSLLSTVFLEELFNFCSTPKNNKERLLYKIADLITNEQRGSKILSLLLSWYADSHEEKQKLIADCITEKVAKVFALNKSKPSLTHPATCIMEFITKVVDKINRNAHTQTHVIDFCSQLCLHPINYSGSLVYSEGACAVELKEHIFLPLLAAVSRIMAQELNFGGADNFMYLDHSVVPLLELCTHVIFVLQRGIGADRKPLFELFSSRLEKCSNAEDHSKIRAALSNLLSWLMLNSNIALSQQPTPTGSLLKQLYNNSSRLFRNFFSNINLALMAVDALFAHLKSVYASLAHRSLRGEGQGYMALVLAENVSDFLSSVIEELASSKILLFRFLNENSGLEFIFKLLDRWLASSYASTQASASILNRLQQYGVRKQLMQEKSASSPLVSLRDKALFEVELGNRIQLFFEDKSFVSPLISDWQANKKGVDKALYGTVFPFNKKQLRLRLRLSAPAHIRTIKIGFYFQRWEKQLTLGQPSYVRMNLLLDEKPSRLPLGELSRIEDAGYASCLTTVYVLNLDRLRGEYEEAISKLAESFRFVDFELVIGRPIVTVVDKISPIYARCAGPTSLFISFISVEGFLPSSIDIDSTFQKGIRKTFYKAIEFLFDNETSVDAIEMFFDTLPGAERKALFKLIEGQLEGLVEHSTIKLSKFFLIITNKEPLMANTLFYLLLQGLSSNTHFVLLIEALVKSAASPELLLALFSHCTGQIVDGSYMSSQTLDVLCNCLLDRCANTNEEVCLALPVTLELYKELLGLYSVKPQDNSLLRILAIIPYLFSQNKVYASVQLSPESYLSKKNLANPSTELVSAFIEQVYLGLTQKQNQLLPLLATLATKIELASDLLFKQGMLQIIVDTACALSEDSLYAHSALQILCTMPANLEKLNTLGTNEKLCRSIEPHISSPKLAASQGDHQCIDHFSF